MNKFILAFLQRIRTNFFTGIVVSAPIILTFWFVIWFISGPIKVLDQFIRKRIDPELLGGFQFNIPGLGIVIAFLFFIFIGFMARNFIGKFFYDLWDNILTSTPLIKNLYGFFKNVFTTISNQSNKNFKEVGLIEFPRKGMLAICFIVSKSRGVIHHAACEMLFEEENKNKENSDKAVDEEIINIFIPTSPNPTSGFLTFVPRSSVKILDLTVEEAAKVVFSAGVVDPHAERKTTTKKK